MSLFTRTLMTRAAKFARSPQGRQLAAKAKTIASDPDTKRKVEQARQRLATRRKP